MQTGVIVIVAVVFEIKLPYLGVSVTNVLDNELVLSYRIRILCFTIDQFHMLIEEAFQFGQRRLIGAEDIIILDLSVIPEAVDTSTGEVEIRQVKRRDDLLNGGSYLRKFILHLLRF